MPHHILYVHHASVLGGAEVSLLELVRCLDQERFQPLVMLPESGPLLSELADRGVDVSVASIGRLTRTFNPFSLCRYCLNIRKVRRQLHKLIENEKINLVHCNGLTSLLFVGAVPQRMGVPCVCHLRDARPLCALQRRYMRHASKLIAVSGAVARVVESDRTVIVHNGVNPDVFHPEVDGKDVRSELGIEPEAIVMGMVAQWVPWKRHDVFLDAAREIAASHPQVCFLLVGRDQFDDHPEIAQMIHAAGEEEPLHGRMIVAGQRSDMPSVMGAMDILVLPSENEPFGRTLVEAMATGKAVICVRGGGPEEIVTPECGLLLETPDAGQLVSGLERLLRDPALRAEMGQAGRERVISHFSSEKCAEHIQAVYEGLID